MSEVANILFDFGNVIIDIDIPGTTQRFLDVKADDIDPDEYHQSIKELIFLYEVDAISTDEFCTRMLGLTRPGLTTADVVELWNSMLVTLPAYRLGMLEQLRHNFNVFMLSNTNFLHIAWVHEHVRTMHGVQHFEADFLDCAYYSHLIKKRKPTPEAFIHVLEDAYITPGRTLFIDDLEQNIQAAEQMGFQTLLSPPGDEIAETLKVMGMY